MTTSPVMGVTDELVAELEFDLEVAETTHQLEASVSREALAALLAERAELLRDAGRYRWLCEPREWPEPVDEAIDCGHKALIDAAIDAAMQSEAKP